MATLGGAKALQLDHILGNFAVGKVLDAFVLSVSAPVGGRIWIHPADTPTDVFQKLFHLADDRNITWVFVQGRDVTPSSLSSSSSS